MFLLFTFGGVAQCLIFPVMKYGASDIAFVFINFTTYKTAQYLHRNANLFDYLSY